MGTVTEKRTFVCRNCGKVVTIEEEGRHENNKLDRRTAFCCDKCRRQFWRKTGRARSIRIEAARRIQEELGL